MSQNRMIFIGEKESFIVRVLLKKIQDTGVECRFVPWSIDDINSNINDMTLVAVYIDSGEMLHRDVLHFLVDRMLESDLKMVVIGEQRDITTVCEQVPEGLIYNTYTRPVNNALFVDSISEYFIKMNKNEFKKSILIVDDDPQYLMLVREWLREKYKVSMANSGLQAIKWLGKNKVDLILLDHEMPVTSGPQVLEMLRSDEETRSIPVMFLTGKGDKQSVMAVVALKPEGYFLKSIRKEELLDKLEEYFILHS